MATRVARARLNVDERRTQLLKLGLELFADRPPDQVSIDEIAQAAGISKGLLYHYFPSKRDYYREAMRLASEQLLESIEESAEHADDAPLARLRAGIDGYLDFVEARATGYVILIQSGSGDPEVSAIVERSRRVFASRLLERIGMVEPPPLLRTLLRGWVGFVERVSIDWLELRDFDREAMREACVGLLLEVLSSAGLPVPREEPR